MPASHGAVLRGIHVRGDGPGVLVLYGSNQKISGVRELLRILHDGGYSTLCCDYRGTGYSSGAWASWFLDDDARALYEWFKEETGGPVGVVGISIGAIAAAGLLDRPDPPAAVVLDRPVNPTTVVQRFLQPYVGRVGGAISLAIVRAGVDVDVKRQLERTRTDTLLLLPEYDFLLPPVDVGHLTKNAAPRVETATIPGGHLSSHLVDPVAWRTALLDFLDPRLRPGQPPAGGRAVPPDPVGIAQARIDGRCLEVTFAADPPADVTLLLMGHRRNGLIRIENPARHLRYPLTRRQRRKLGPLFAVRALPEGYIKTSGTSWFGGEVRDR